MSAAALMALAALAGGVGAGRLQALSTKKFSEATQTERVPVVVGSTNKKASQSHRRTDECPEVPPEYVIAADADTRYDLSLEGSYVNPISIVPGCPFTVEVAPGKSAYFTLSGFSTPDQYGSMPMVFYSWNVDGNSADTPVSLFSFRQRPTNGEADEFNFYDWYYWPLLEDDAVTFRDDSLGEDIDYYHCYGGCGYEDQGLLETCTRCGEDDLRMSSDDLMITISAFNMASTVTVTTTADILYPSKFIEPAQLNAIKDMYSAMCLPYLAPDGWDWDSYQRIESDERGEMDSRRKPYCDWWQISQTELDAIGELDCLNIPGVVCDSEGNVADMIVDEVGLRGPLPSSFSALTAMRYLEMPNNRIEGELPQHIFDSPSMKKLSFYNNFMIGEIPCPTSNAENLATLSLGVNFLTGEIPSCIFTRMPALNILDLERNSLETTIPAEIVQSTSLAALHLEASGVTGSIDRLVGLDALGSVDLSHNFLTGSLSQELIDSLPRLYQIDLSWNLLSGSVPSIDNNPRLRIVDLSHNKLDGEVGTKFNAFAAQQSRSLPSRLDISSNFFCGPLPEVFYDLIMDSHYFVRDLDIAQNHFRCSIDGRNKYFDSWAFTMNRDLGKCVPIPVVTGIEDRDEIFPGSEVVVTGDFVSTTDGTCKFAFESETAIVPAVFYSDSRLGCTLPADAPLGFAQVTVAHYCGDFASSETLDGFEAVSFEIYEYDGTPGSSKKTSKADKALITWTVVAAVCALLACSCVGFMLCREKSGNPLFKPLKDTENPIHISATTEIDQDGGLDKSEDQHDAELGEEGG